MRDWRVVTKLPAVPKDVDDVGRWVLDAMCGSLSRLNVERVYGLLLHRAQDLAERGHALHAALVAARTRGLATKIGVSIYDPSELEPLSHFALDLVQAPYNVVDRRLAVSGWLARLCSAGVEVHVRSVFLQGLLLLPPSRRPTTFAQWSALWTRWDGWLKESGLTALQASLGFALATPGIDRVIVGVDSVTQLEDIIAAAGVAVPATPADLVSTDLELISPNRWSRS